MRHWALKMLAGLVALTTWPVHAQSQPASEPATDIRGPAFGAALDGAMRSHMTALGVPGMGVAIVTRDGAVVTRGMGYGQIDGKPVAVDADTSIMPIASISKTFAMVALMRLADRGLVNLDAPAQRYVDFKLATYRGARPFTLRELARHEAGYEERWLATGSGGETPDPRPLRQILAETQPRMIAVPGAYSSYSNYGAALIGYIVERLGRRPYPVFLRDEVLRPLGMTSTTVFDPTPPDLVDRTLLGWKVSNGVARPDTHFFNVRSLAAGRVQASLPDMARYMLMLLNGGRTADGRQFLSPAAIRALMFQVKRIQPSVPGIAAIFAEKDILGIRFIGHGGDGGAHHTDMLLSPTLGIGIFVADLSAPGAQAREQFERAILPSLLPGQTSAWQALPASPGGDLSAYAGSYRHYRWAFTSIEKILGLSSEFAVKDSGKGTLVMTGRLGAGEYVPVDGRGLFRHRFTGEYLFLHRDPTGRMLLNAGNFPFVTAFKLDSVDTQAFNGYAFWIFAIGLTLGGIVLLVMAVRRRGSGRARDIAAFATTGVALLACGIGLYEFYSIAAGLEENTIQMAVPSIGYWLLSIPPIACIAIAAVLIARAARLWRPGGLVEHLSIALAIILFALFIAWLVHWHAFGWQFP